MKIVAILGCLVLVGCTTQLPKEVKIPVPVFCTTPDPVKPELHFNPPYTDLFPAVRDLLGDRKQEESYVTSLEAALKSCKDTTTP